MKTLALLFLTLFSVNYYAQLNGDYTVGGSDPDFESLTEIFQALESEGVNGPVDFLFRPGTYNGSYALETIDGTSSANEVTFKSENGNFLDVIWESDSLVDGFFLWNLGENSFFNFEQMSFSTQFAGEGDHFTLGSNQFVDQIHINECHFSSLIIDEADILHFTNTHDISIIDNYFGPCEDAICIVGDGSNNVIVSNNEIYLVDDAFEFENCNSLTVTNNIIEHEDFIDSEELTFEIRGNSNEISINNNSIEGFEIGLLDQYSGEVNSFTFSNNHVNAENSYFYSSYVQTVLLENNTNIGVSDFDFYACADFTALNNQFDELNVELADKVLIADNTFEGQIFEGEGLELSELTLTQDAIIERNTFKFVEGLYIEETDESEFKISVRNNAFINCDDAFESWIGGNIEFVYNSISGGLNSTNTYVQVSESTSFESHNNIFYSGEMGVGEYVYDIDEETDFVSDNNCYFWDLSDEDFELSYDTFQTLEDAQNAGFELSSVFTDPLFFDPQDDLRICNSDLLGVGIGLSDIQFDFFGNSRPGSATTPGLYEIVPLNAEFQLIQNDNTIEVIPENLSSAENWTWDFGDGNTSFEESPIHSYDELGNFTVTLSVESPCGEEISEEDVSITIIGVEEKDSPSLSIYPNPSEGMLNLSSDTYQIGIIRVADLNGRIVFECNGLNENCSILDLTSLESGVYFITAFDIGSKSKTVEKVVLK